MKKEKIEKTSLELPDGEIFDVEITKPYRIHKLSISEDEDGNIQNISIKTNEEEVPLRELPGAGLRKDLFKEFLEHFIKKEEEEE